MDALFVIGVTGLCLWIPGLIALGLFSAVVRLVSGRFIRARVFVAVSAVLLVMAELFSYKAWSAYPGAK